MTKRAPKLIARKDVTELCRRLRRRGRKIVFTNGVFDIIHMGHVSYLTKARALGDVLIIGLNADVSVHRIKGPSRPINSQADRAGVLSALVMVDYVVTFFEDTPEKLIRQVRPHVLVKGADYEISEIVGAEFVKANGGEVRRIRMMPGRSTSDILRRLK